MQYRSHLFYFIFLSVNIQVLGSSNENHFVLLVHHPVMFLVDFQNLEMDYESNQVFVPANGWGATMMVFWVLLFQATRYSCPIWNRRSMNEIFLNW